MPRWKTTANLLNVKNDGEVWQERWMEGNSLVIPPHPVWTAHREISFNDVYIWEVICETSGLSGVYAAWCPYAEYYIVTQNWSLMAEFSGPNANNNLELYLQANGVDYPKSKTEPIPPEFVNEYFKHVLRGITAHDV